MWTPTTLEATVIAIGLLTSALAFRYSFNRALDGNPILGIGGRKPVAIRTAVGPAGHAASQGTTHSKSKGGWGWSKGTVKEEHSGQVQTVNVNVGTPNEN